MMMMVQSEQKKERTIQKKPTVVQWGHFKLALLINGNVVCVLPSIYLSSDLVCISLKSMERRTVVCCAKCQLSFYSGHSLMKKYIKPPTNPFTILEHQNPSHDVPELHKIRRSPDLKALKV